MIRSLVGWAGVLAAATFVAGSIGCARLAPPLYTELSEIPEIPRELPQRSTRGPLTLDDAISRAYAASEDIAAGIAGVHVITATRLAVSDLRDPQLRLSYDTGESDSDRMEFENDARGTIVSSDTAVATEDADGYRIGLRFYPPNPFVNRRAVSAESANVLASIAELVHAQWELAIQVRTLFIQMHFLAQEQALTEELVSTYRQALNMTRQRLKRGESTVDEATRAQRRYLESLSDHDETRRAFGQARRELASLAAVDVEQLDIDVQPNDIKRIDFTAMNTDQLINTAIHHRRDLAALYWRTREAEDRLSGQKATRLPWPDFIQGRYSHAEADLTRRTSFNGGGPIGSSRMNQNAEQDEWRIDIAFSIPVFSAFNHGEDVLEAELEQAKVLELKTGERIRREIRDAIDSLRDIERSRRLYDQETGPVIDDLERILAQVEAGLPMAPDDAARLREEMLETRRMKLESRLEYELAVIRLEQALGMPLPDATGD